MSAVGCCGSSNANLRDSGSAVAGAGGPAEATAQSPVPQQGGDSAPASNVPSTSFERDAAATGGGAADIRDPRRGQVDPARIAMSGGASETPARAAASAAPAERSAADVDGDGPARPAAGTSSTAETGTTRGTAADSTSAAGATRSDREWKAWEARFAALQLAPVDIEYLRTSGYDDQRLGEIAAELEQQPLVTSDPAAASVATAGTPSSGVVGSTPEAAAAGAHSSGTGQVDPAVSPDSGTPSAGASAWNPQWEQKFRTLLKDLGMDQAAIDQQIKAVQGQEISENQLQEAYVDLKSQMGSWNESWRGRFQKLFEELGVPKAQQDEALESLAGRGLDDKQLQEFYDQTASQKPAWNETWNNRFKALGLPDEMIKQLKDSKAPEEALRQSYDDLTKRAADARTNGRWKKLDDAKATADERWGALMGDLSNKDFDKAVEGIHSRHVPGWKRAASMAVNFIPGVGTLQYLSGKDWITGEKIDRSNPLNIGMAILSAIPVATSIKGGMQAIKGASMITRGLQAGSAAAGSAGAANAAGMTIGSGTRAAIQGANLTAKLTTGLSLVDKLKLVTPVVNRIGQTGQLYSIGNGFYKGQQFLTALKAAEYARAGIKPPAGGFTPETLKGLSQADRLKVLNIDSSVAKLADNSAFLTKNHTLRLNPFSNKAGVSATRMDGVVPAITETGETLLKDTRYTQVLMQRGVNPRSLGGIAQIKGSITAANISAAPVGLQAGAMRAAGVNPRVAEQVGLDKAALAAYGERFGVHSGGKFRSLLQLPRRVFMPNSTANVQRAAADVRFAGNNAYAAARWVQGGLGRQFVGPMAAMGTFQVLSGQGGKLTQPLWDYHRNKGELDRQQRQAEAAYAREQAEIAAAQAAVAAEGAGTGTAASRPTPGADAGTVDGTAPRNGAYADPSATSGGGVAGNSTNGGGAAGGDSTSGIYTDPRSGFYVDPASGLAMDPQTGSFYEVSSGRPIDPSSGTYLDGPAASSGTGPAVGPSATNPTDVQSRPQYAIAP